MRRTKKKQIKIYKMLNDVKIRYLLSDNDISAAYLKLNCISSDHFRTVNCC